jgi:hypothetical protein
MNESNTFGKTLGEIRGGDCLSELSEMLGELVGRVRETGKAGELILKLKVKPASRGNIGAVVIEDKPDVKMPPVERAQSLFFATESNTLQRNDPNQSELKFKTVEGGRADVATLKQVNG